MTTDAKFPSDAAEKFVVRFPDGMRDRIADAAKQSGRSMNAEIIQRLESTFGESAGLPGGDVLASLPALKELDAQIGTMAKRVARLSAQLDPSAVTPAGRRPAAKKSK
ncbi:Arc family DNA-binding protein [Paucibacter sp. R3-3]|uniref:Arc family DNA-binding protein n=1 Tax=Roseateles agri TaxID=3098619 RepID=A0ABU5DJT3_9BURK|nr:Arc family DNA-binding protein [Paucibacter sp. R3-3]MDY0746554.1 Arc family DNA-binding protein [Paucibacter sp. R3-3]